MGKVCASSQGADNASIVANKEDGCLGLKRGVKIQYQIGEKCKSSKYALTLGLIGRWLAGSRGMGELCIGSPIFGNKMPHLSSQHIMDQAEQWLNREQYPNV